MKKPLALIIMDGFGINGSDYGNAIKAAKTPNLDKIFSTYPTTEIGAYIVYTSTDFNTGLYGELSQMTDYGWDGVAKLNAINFATGFNSAAYDFSFNMTIDPAQYDSYSAYYLMDEADFFENY